MTEQMLVNILFCLCSKLQPRDAIMTCMEQYVNCAVTRDGRILTLREFDDKCAFKIDQDRCYDKAR